MTQDIFKLKYWPKLGVVCFLLQVSMLNSRGMAVILNFL